MIFELAGRAGTAPWEYTLRELVLQADAATDAQWWQTATICAMVANTVRDRKKRPRPFEPREFHPMHNRRSAVKLSPKESLEWLATAWGIKRPD